MWVTGAEIGVLDSDAVYIKAEPLLCFKYFLEDEGTNDGALTIIKGVEDLKLIMFLNNDDVTSFVETKCKDVSILAQTSDNSKQVRGQEQHYQCRGEAGRQGSIKILITTSSSQSHYPRARELFHYLKLFYHRGIA